MSSAGLGRIHVPDQRDRNFRMSAPATERTFRNWMVPGEINDQGATPHCVAHACEAFLRALPVVNAHREDLDINAVTLYREAQKVDQWPGENYDGTSVRAGFKILTRWGFVSRYEWAWDTATITRHILEIGPVVVGTTWTYGMFTPDRRGYIHPDGGSVGGHAYLLTCANTRRKNPDGTIGAYRIQNSWGPGWGENGRAWISIIDMEQLIQDYGEACTAAETRKR